MLCFALLPIAPPPSTTPSATLTGWKAKCTLDPARAHRWIDQPRGLAQAALSGHAEDERARQRRWIDNLLNQLGNDLVGALILLQTEQRFSGGVEGLRAVGNDLYGSFTILAGLPVV
ncbi:MAG: hypothetical protein ACOYL5_18320 [Phototrophicaceae bacterium]|jgi:hypothetical protein